MVVVALLVLSMPLTAMADGTYRTITTYNLANNTITTTSTVSGLTGATEQVAYIAYLDNGDPIADGDIIYIDQDAATSNGKAFTYTFDASKIFDGTTKLNTAVKFGAETTATIGATSTVDATIGMYKVTTSCVAAEGSVAIDSDAINSYVGTENGVTLKFTPATGYATDTLTYTGQPVVTLDGVASYTIPMAKLTSDITATVTFKSTEQAAVNAPVPEGEPQVVFDNENPDNNEVVGYGTSILSGANKTFVERGIIIGFDDADMTIDAPKVTGIGQEFTGAMRFPALGAHNASEGKFAVAVKDGGSKCIPAGKMYKTRTYMIYNDGSANQVVYGDILTINP